MKLDTAVLKVLKLDADNTTVSSAGGGGCSSASTSKIVSKLHDGTEKSYFMKTGSGSAAETMFEGMHCRRLKVEADRSMKVSTRRSMLLTLSSHHYVRNHMVTESLSQIHKHRSLSQTF